MSIGSLLSKFEVSGDVSCFRFIPPNHCPETLAPMEDFLLSLGHFRRRFSLELVGHSGVVSYLVRSDDPSGLQSMLSPCYPQGRYPMVPKVGDEGGGAHPVEEGGRPDWLLLPEDENVLVQPLWLRHPSWLPLRTYADDDLQRATMDPLAAVLGTLSRTGATSGGAGVEYLGLRVLLQPVGQDWGRGWQSKMQIRKDGDDHIREDTRPIRDESPGSSIPLPAVLAGVGLLGLGYYNWQWYQSGDYYLMAASALGAVAATVAGGVLWSKFKSNSSRQYFDERAVEEKLGSLGFNIEVQMLATYRGDFDGPARDALNHLSQAMRKFNYSSGNSWREGKAVKVERDPKALMYHGSGLPDTVSALGVFNSRHFARSIVSAREVAGLWHPPLIEDEMASMERAGVRNRIPYLEGLDSGAPVGFTVGSQELLVCLPDAAIAKHGLFIGKSGSGKSTMIKHVVAHRMQDKARGVSNGAIVVIDPHADLVQDILQIVPPEIAHKVRVLHLGRTDRIPAINMMDPQIFTDRDRCVDTIIDTLRHLWEGWGPRLQDILDRSLKAIYEYNCHPDTERSQMLTMLDILRLLEDGKVTRTGRTETVEQTPFQKHVLSRVNDPDVVRWFGMFMNWPRDTRAESLGPVQSRMGSYASNARSKVLLGQRESTIVLSDVLKEEQILLVATASGTIGKGPAALMGGTIVSLIDSALRDQEKLPFAERKKCLLIADEFQTITGTDWESLLAEIRKYGCSVLLATQSVSRLDTPERKLKDGVLGNCGFLISYQISSADAQIISGEMGREWVTEEDLIGVDPYCCYAKINLSTKSVPAFSLKTLPPPELGKDPTDAIYAVEEAMKDYTCDFNEALAKITKELRDSLNQDQADRKIGVDQEPTGGGGSAVRRPAGGPPGGDTSRLYERFNERNQARRVVPDASPVTAVPMSGDGAAVPVGVVAASVGKPSATPDFAVAVVDPVLVDGDKDAPALRQPALSAEDPHRVALKRAGLTDEQIDRSSFSPQVLDMLNSNLARDPTLQFLCEKRLTGRVNSIVGKRLAEVTEDIRAEERAAAAQQVAEAREDAYAQARRDVESDLRGEVEASVREKLTLVIAAEAETTELVRSMHLSLFGDDSEVGAGGEPSDGGTPAVEDLEKSPEEASTVADRSESDEGASPDLKFRPMGASVLRSRRGDRARVASAGDD